MIAIIKSALMLEILKELKTTEYYMVSDFIQLNLNQQQLHYRISAASTKVDRFKLTEEWLDLTRYQP